MSGRHKLSDPNLRDRLLDQIRGGAGRYEAAKAVGLSVGAYKNYLKVNPEFREDVEAAINASIEPVTKMLRRKALNEEDVSAAKEYRQFIERDAPAPATTVKHEHTLNLGAVSLGQIEAVTDLRNKLADRRAVAELEEGDIVDAEVIDDTLP